MNTLIDTKIKEFWKKYPKYEVRDYDSFENRVRKISSNIELQSIEDFLRSSLQDIEKHTREEDATKILFQIENSNYDDLTIEAIKIICKSWLKEKK